ncbi:MAG TPA: endonuclease/exonuclease/phosphatase family protein [Polyangiaceae bacterium]|nr:endonuclease/exonuclease/phosphatase family protein [Polyangiaceae bacterium]HMR77584.1 endonuclease/exonuclease/phosphatase family protein [Polyangiaceae bacterium]
MTLPQVDAASWCGPLLAALLLSACGDNTDFSFGNAGGTAGADASAAGTGGLAGSSGSAGSAGSAGNPGSAGASGADAGTDGSAAAPPVVVGTFNLHNFSIYGDSEYRIDALAKKIDEVDADVLGVQELKVKSGTTGAPSQAWDAMLAKLPGRNGTHGAWSTFDSTVGFVWDTTTTTLLDQESLFDGDPSAFPRPPVLGRFRIQKQGASVELNVIVVHLKAFQASFERRREACKKLRSYIDAQADRRFAIVGDFNDDPYDVAADNSYVGTFLDQKPAYHFLTKELPPTSVTSTGYYHYVAGKKITGEFLDHVIATDALMAEFSSATPKIFSQPPSSYSAWKASHSDHFPVVVSFLP